MKRYLVTVEREVIVYASTRAEAGRKACIAVAYGMGTAPAKRPITATKVKRLPLPEKEERGPVIDVAPARETR